MYYTDNLLLFGGIKNATFHYFIIAHIHGFTHAQSKLFE
jgi:hypothetical protein